MYYYLLTIPDYKSWQHNDMASLACVPVGPQWMDASRSKDVSAESAAPSESEESDDSTVVGFGIDSLFCSSDTDRFGAESLSALPGERSTCGDLLNGVLLLRGGAIL